MNRYDELLDHFKDLQSKYRHIDEIDKLQGLIEILKRAHDDHDVEEFQKTFARSLKDLEDALKDIAKALNDIQEEVTIDIKDVKFQISEKMHVQFVDEHGNSHVEKFNPNDGYYFTKDEPREMRLSGSVGFAIYQRIVEDKPYLFFSPLQGSLNAMLSTRNQGELVRGKLDHVLKNQVHIGEPYYIYVTEGEDHNGPHQLIGWLRVYS